MGAKPRSTKKTTGASYDVVHLLVARFFWRGRRGAFEVPECKLVSMGFYPDALEPYIKPVRHGWTANHRLVTCAECRATNGWKDLHETSWGGEPCDCDKGAP